MGAECSNLNCNCYGDRQQVKELAVVVVTEHTQVGLPASSSESKKLAPTLLGRLGRSNAMASEERKIDQEGLSRFLSPIKGLSGCFDAFDNFDALSLSPRLSDRSSLPSKKGTLNYAKSNATLSTCASTVSSPTSSASLLTSRSEYSEVAPNFSNSRLAQVASRVKADIPNFHGRWVITSIEGESGLFMADTGASEPSPRQVFDYGMGSRIQQITQDGNDITITNITVLGPHVIHSDCPMSFRVGGGAVKTRGLDGLPMVVSAVWEGSALVMKCRRTPRKKYPEPLKTFRRYMDGHQMVVEVQLDNDKMVRRVFVPKGE